MASPPPPKVKPEEVILLKEMGDGLLCSQYLTMSRLHASRSLGRPTEEIYSKFVQDSKFSSLRNRIGNAFPKVADLKGVEGQMDFERSAGNVIRFFARFKALVHDLVDFTEAALPILLTLPSSLATLSLTFNRSTTMLYVDLLCTYIRVMHFFATNHEAKIMYALNATAEKVYKENSDSEPIDSPPGSPNNESPKKRRQTITVFGPASVIPLTDIATPQDKEYLLKSSKLFKDTFDGLHVYLMSTFKPLLTTLTQLLEEMAPSVALARDIEHLCKNTLLLDPARMGEAMAQPDCPKLSKLSTLPTYMELADYERYTDAAILFTLVCPAVLFNDPVRKMVQDLVQDLLVIRLFRDVSVNVHLELEAVIMLLCPAGMSSEEKRKMEKTMGKPRGLKLRQESKEWARTAVQNCSQKQQIVRTHLAAQLVSLNALLDMSPGLLGPRFPQVIAMASLAKTATMNYFRHANNEELKMRRDCKHLHDFGVYTQSYEATELLSALLDLVGTCQKHKNIITSYYATFVGTCDAEALTKLCSKMNKGGLAIPALLPIIQTFPGTLTMALSSVSSVPTNSLNQSVRASIIKSNGGFSGGVFASVGGTVSRESIIFGRRSSIDVKHDLETGVIGGGVVDLFPLRLNWERCMMALSGHAMDNFRSFPLIIEMMRKMPRVCERTRYVDDIERVITQYFEPYELCWFQNPVEHAFMTAISNTSCVDAPSHSLCYMLVPLLIRRNVHVDCPAEDELVGRDSVRFLDELLSALGDHVVTGVKGLWHGLQVLEAQRMPLEAARRVERIYAERAKGLYDHNHTEPLPGVESEARNAIQIESLISHRTNLFSLIAAVRKMGHIVCFDREYSVENFVRQRVVAYIEQRLHGLFLHVTRTDEGELSDETLQPLALGFHKLMTGLHVATSVLSLIDGANTAADTHSRAQSAIQMVLFRECSDVLIPPPGAVLSPLTEPTSDALIWTIALWFSGLVEQSASSSGVICVPSSRAFGHLVVREAREDDEGETTGGHTGFELFLTVDEMTALCSVIGPQGARVIESQLLRSICYRVKTGILPFLLENRTELLALASEPHDTIQSVMRLVGLETLLDHLVTIGLTLSLRLALLGGLREAVGRQAPNLGSVLRSAACAVHLWGNRTLAAPLYSLAGAAGQPPVSCDGAGADAALCLALEEAISGEVEEEVFLLLPVACAAAFASPSWSQACYLPEHDVFEGNHHLLPLAVSTLICVYFGRDKEQSNYSFDRAAQQERVDFPRRLMSHVCRDFLYISAQILHTVRMSEDSTFADLPVSPLAMLLQRFCSICPAADASVLQAVFPFALQHHGNLGVGLDRIRLADKDSSFRHVKAKEAYATTTT